MKIRLFPVLAVSCMILAACQGVWTKPGATTDLIDSDMEACEQSAIEQFPVEMSSADSSNRKEYQTLCTSYGNQTNCTTRSDDTGGSYQYDRNQEERQQAVNRCMESRGYQRQ